MKTQDYAKIYGLDLPAKVRMSKDKTKLCLTDMNEALIVGQHGELLERISNPWARKYVGKGKSEFTPEDLAFQDGWEYVSPNSVEIYFN